MWFLLLPYFVLVFNFQYTFIYFVGVVGVIGVLIGWCSS